MYPVGCTFILVILSNIVRFVGVEKVHSFTNKNILTTPPGADNMQAFIQESKRIIKAAADHDKIAFLPEQACQ